MFKLNYHKMSVFFRVLGPLLYWDKIIQLCPNEARSTVFTSDSQ